MTKKTTRSNDDANLLDGLLVKIGNRIYKVKFSPDVSDDATIEFDDCEIIISERLYNCKLTPLLERFFHEVCHGYENYFEAERLFNIDSKQKEDTLEAIVQLAAKSFVSFMFDNTESMEDLLRAVKKEKKY